MHQPLPDIRFKDLAAALLARVETLLPSWLPGGHWAGPEWVCASLAGGAGRSCSVNRNDGKWADFAGDAKGGDLISLYAAIHGLDMGQAALQLARQEGLEHVAGIVTGAPADTAPRRPAPPPAPAPERPRENWRTLTPVPASACKPNFLHHTRRPQDITHTAVYQAGGDLYGYVVRFRTSDGGKDTLPYTWCQSEANASMAWRWRQWDEPRPLYLPARQRPKDGQTVVLVEGEKKADALSALLNAASPGIYCVASWPGGCKAWQKADWAWLHGCHVLLWPDCDAKREPLTAAERKACADPAALDAAQAARPLLPPERQPGVRAMHAIGRRLQTEHACRVQTLPIPQPGDVKDGWDCGDAIETDGWDAARILAFFGQAQPLPPENQAAPTPSEPRAKRSPPGPAGAGAGDSGERPPPEGCPDWLLPFWRPKRGNWDISRQLVIQALRSDPDLAGVLGYNELSNTIEARRNWPWPHGESGPIRNNTDLALGQYLSDRWQLPSISRATLSEGIETVAHEVRFHPVREYLESLAWDGTPRLNKWLIHVLGHKPEQLQPAMAEYLAKVGRYWLLGMVNRVMHPGCKFDYCPVLEGPGGLGKSTLVETLASTAFFSDTHFDLGSGKEGQEQVQGLWCYEISELAGISKAEVGLIKAFITAKVDRYRPAYGRVLESFPRQCVMVGTTNDRAYLRDRTGNRRFWPIPVRQALNIAWVAKWRDALFAEALVLCKAGEPYTPSRDDEQRLFAPMQESRLIETAVTSQLMELLTRAPLQSEIGQRVNGLVSRVTMSDVVLALGVDPAKSNAALESQIRAWFDHEGWQSKRLRGEGSQRFTFYLRPDNWPQDTGSDTPMDELIDPARTSIAAAQTPPPDPAPTPAAVATDAHGYQGYYGLDDENIPF